MNTVEKAVKNLLDNRPFYAYFFLDSKIEYDKYGVATAGATISAKGPTLIFNTKFIESLTPEELSGVVEHEVLHLLFDHVSMDRKLYNPQVANVAQDLSINQYIPILPKGCVTLDGVSKQLGVKLDPNQTWEHYYYILMQKAEEMGGMDSFDDHDLEAGEEPCSAGERQAALRSTMDRAIKAAKGNVPDSVLKIYDSIKGNSTVPWEQVLSNFVSRASSTTMQNTRKKLNRRFGLDQPGKKKKKELVLGVCTDSSGSVSDDSYQKFLSEIVRVSQICQMIYLVDADCVVQGVESIKKGKPVRNERRGNGGTAYQPAIDECMKRKCDAIIYFGDFDCADTPVDPGIPFLWVGVGNSPKPGNFGAEIRI